MTDIHCGGLKGIAYKDFSLLYYFSWFCPPLCVTFSPPVQLH